MPRRTQLSVTESVEQSDGFPHYKARHLEKTLSSPPPTKINIKLTMTPPLSIWANPCLTFDVPILATAAPLLLLAPLLAPFVPAILIAFDECTYEV
jgi:hypothetical protein